MPNKLISFFHLEGITGMNVVAVFLYLGVFGIFALIWCLYRYKVIQKWRASNLPLMSLIPIFGKRFIKETVKYQKEMAKNGKQYSDRSLSMEERKAAFMEFIRDLPIFMIDEGFISTKIRGMLASGGARFQQVVLHDSSDTEDVYVWVRKDGNYFMHDKGVYLFPWDNQKSILHWDIQDMRPLFDKAKEAQWQNPLMNARYFWGILNSRSMSPQNDQSGTNKLLIILIAIAILVAGYGAYQDYNYHKELMPILAQIANNTAKPVVMGAP